MRTSVLTFPAVKYFFLLKATFGTNVKPSIYNQTFVQTIPNQRQGTKEEEEKNKHTY